MAATALPAVDVTPTATVLLTPTIKTEPAVAIAPAPVTRTPRHAGTTRRVAVRSAAGRMMLLCGAAA